MEVRMETSSQTFRTKVAGVTFGNDDGTNRQDLLRQCRSGDAVRLARERDNSHSENDTAIAVHLLSGQKLGYIPGGDVRLARHMDQGGEVEARIVKVTGGPGLLGRLIPAMRRYYGCVIEVKKHDPDWSALEPWMTENRAIDNLIKDAVGREREDPEMAVASYREASRRLAALDAAGQQAAACRTTRYPVNRLSLVLQRMGCEEEALAEIKAYAETHDRVGLTKADARDIARREKKLER